MPAASVILTDGSHTPALTTEQARAAVAERWGLEGDVRDLGSYQDQVFRVRAGARGDFALKLSHTRADPAALAMENAALRHVAARLDDVAVPAVVPALDGAEITTVASHHARLLTWVPGRPLATVRHLGGALRRALGDLAARCGEALADFSHPAAHRAFQWDTRHVAELVAAAAPYVDADERALLDAALDALAAGVTAAGELPRQIVHTDVTDENVVGALGRDGRLGAIGLLDFGDVVHTWRLCDPAGAAFAAVTRDPDDALGAALAVLDGYRAATAVAEAEADAFWPVVVGRAALCAAASARQTAVSAPTEHLAGMRRADWAGLRACLAVPPAPARAAARATCGVPPWPAAAGLSARVAAAAPAPLLEGLSAQRLVAADLGVGAPGLVAGGWESADGVAAALAGDGVAVGRWGEVRLLHAGTPGERAPQALHLGADLFVAAGTPVHAPLSGHVLRAGAGELVLEVEADAYIRLAGLEPAVAPGAEVARAERVGHVAAPRGVLPAHVHVQLCAVPDLPGLAAPARRDAWLALCPDPSPLVGIDAAAPLRPDAGAERARRRRVVAGAQSLYYETPVEMVRGWRQRLYDADARPYLDMVNNVAVVGHSHPGVAAAARRQLELLNTNSRFLYDAMTEYAERVAALLPRELGTVFLVNSGSEALDLAIQLAQAYTGRHDLAAIAGAYHGWTLGVFAACTSPQDNPEWRATIPRHVHVVDQPDPYRGPHGDDAAPYVASVAAACRAAAARGGLAAFLSEALLGNQGALAPPRGYMAGAYAAVRAAGGLCIADEVQVGYARTGTSFWAFEHEGVVPDIVAAAKATGNGHPVGVVACRREIADALGRRASFFSSTGGGPVSCRVGLAVLDAIRDERLQDNAAVVGARLKAGLEELATRHPEIGAVHGRGLYLGVDLVRDRATREPAVEETLVICERLRELGVVMQPTGDAYNVLKVKPPLCLSAADADFFVAALDRALGERAERA